MQQEKKLDSKSTKCVFLGVSEESKAYRLYDPVTRKILISRDVVFAEQEVWNWKDSNKTGTDYDFDDSEGSARLQEETHPDAVQETNEEEINIPATQNENIDTEQDNANQSSVAGETADNEINKRMRRPPLWHNDYRVGNELESDDDLLTSEQAHNLMTCIDNDPTTYEEAAKEEKWVEAMKTEIASIERNRTWDLLDLPTGGKIIGVKWVYKTKFNEEGKIDKFKARLVAKGYAQEYGVDFSEVYDPVARWETIRTILAVAASKGWKVYQLDIKSAFLYGDLEEVVHVEQPKGFVKEGQEDKVYRLRKALYGLK